MALPTRVTGTGVEERKEQKKGCGWRHKRRGEDATEAGGWPTAPPVTTDSSVPRRLHWVSSLSLILHHNGQLSERGLVKVWRGFTSHSSAVLEER